MGTTGERFFDGSLSAGGVGSLRPLGMWLDVLWEHAADRVFWRRSFAVGECWVVVSKARGMYGSR